ncbi:MAG TPA: enoyl-CoA hydratase/isomerase family protein [Caulobacteraceae bacterium]|nr:enoyl-CoA hydratase/isomerase family protein [Caulobacteraceae bacterium]
MSGEPEVIVRRDGALGVLTLNRPQAIGALTTNMCRLMTEALLAWRDDPAVRAVLVDHAGERGFCAGGDIRALWDSAQVGGAAAREFFFTEYRLNHLMHGYAKPIVTVMDGIVMGGGVGLAWASTYRIATERTTFAMPESGIGLFPDVGGGWHLPRLHGRTGRWLALTGARIKAADCELLGIATDVAPSAMLARFKADLAREPEAIETLLTEIEADAGHPPLADHRDAIDRLFEGPSVEAIVEALNADGSDWAQAQAKTMATKSPLTMKVALRQLDEGLKAKDFAENMAMEMRIAARVVMSPDFSEGVRAVIIDKDNAPKWSPATLEGVAPAMLDAIFAPLPPDQEWSPLPGA